MRYRVGDKVRVRGDLKVEHGYGNAYFYGLMEAYNGKISEITKIESQRYILNGDIRYWWSDEMLRPAEFKIWCETEEEKQAVLEELEKERYMCTGDELKPTKTEITAPIGLSIWKAKWESDSTIKYTKNKEYFTLGDREKYICELTPSEFTGINFFEKIIIKKNPTGATATCGEKTVTTEGDFEDAARQALAEVLCPFKVGDKVKAKYDDVIGVVDSFEVDVRVRIIEADRSRKWWMAESLEPYTEQSYNARLFCIKGSNCFMNDYFKRGHIYEVKNGKIVGYDGGGNYTDINYINNAFSAQFMEVLDD